MTFSNETNSSDSLSMQMLYLAVNAVKLIECDRKLTSYGRIEVVLFNANLARLFLHKKRPRLFLNIQHEFDSNLVDYLISLGLDDRVSDIGHFLNSRAVEMDKELKGMNSEDGWIPSRIYDWFYVQPLKLNTRPEKVDLIKLMTFQMLLSHMIKAIREGLDVIIDQN